MKLAKDESRLDRAGHVVLEADDGGGSVGVRNVEAMRSMPRDALEVAIDREVARRPSLAADPVRTPARRSRGG